MDTETETKQENKCLYQAHLNIEASFSMGGNDFESSFLRHKAQMILQERQRKVRK